MNLKEFGEQLHRFLFFVAVFAVLMLFGLIWNSRKVWRELPWNQFPQGSHCVVVNATWGVSDLGTYQELTKALRIDDSIGVHELVAKGRALQIQAQTPVLVLDVDGTGWDWFLFSYRQVRILSGQGYAKAMWIKKDALALVPGN